MKKQKAYPFLFEERGVSFPEYSFDSFREVTVVDQFGNKQSVIVDFVDTDKKVVFFIDKDEPQLNALLTDNNFLVIQVRSKKLRSNWPYRKKEIAQILFKRSEYQNRNDDKVLIENIQGGFIVEDNNEEDVKNTDAATIQYQDRSEVSDLIGRAPGWLLHSGITIIALVISVILIFAALIRYPDKIVCTGVLTSTNPPIALTPKVSGKIDEILVASGQLVNPNTNLIYLQNTAKRNDVEQMQNFNERYQNTESKSDVLNLSIPDNLALGDLQGIYGQLVLKYKEYQQVMSQQSNSKQISTLAREIVKTKDLNQSLSKEQEIYNQELALIQKDYERSKKLYDEGVISEVELDQANTKLTQYERQKESMQKGSVTNNIRIEALRLERDKIKEQRQNLLDQYAFGINELIAEWNAAYSKWEETYYISAMESGEIEWSSDISNGMNVTSNQQLGHLILSEANTGSNKYIRAKTTSIGIGKLAKGNKAIIKLDAFPYKEYGLIISTVGSISTMTSLSSVDNQSYYEIQIPIADEIITDHKKNIPFTPNMSCTAEILTEDKTILGRIMEQFIDLIKQ